MQGCPEGFFPLVPRSWVVRVNRQIPINGGGDEAGGSLPVKLGLGWAMSPPE